VVLLVLVDCVKLIYKDTNMKMTICCSICNKQLCEINKTQITQQDIDLYTEMVKCDEDHEEQNIGITQKDE
jgi:hypothetical protein